jgi:hypothetical protein
MAVAPVEPGKDRGDLRRGLFLSPQRPTGRCQCEAACQPGWATTTTASTGSTEYRWTGSTPRETVRPALTRQGTWSLCFTALRALLGLVVSAKTSSRTNSEPEAFGRCAIGRLIAIDQAEARFAFVALDVEADSTAVGQLGMATCAHQLAGMWICLAFEEQLGDATLQRIDSGSLSGVGIV